MCIDLTEAYGAGNEPTVAWCNENIPYFEDSYTFAEGSIAIKNHQGEWVKAKKVYQKTSNGWSEITNKYAINSLFSKTKYIDVDYHEKKQSDTFLGHCRALIRPNDAGTSPVDVSKYNQVLTITTPSISTFASPLSDGNKTLSFASTNNAIAINNISTLPKFATEDWTIDWWEYRQDSTTSSSFKMGPTGGTSFMGYYQVGTNLCFYATRGGSSWDVLKGAVGSEVSRNTWVHHAIVRHKSDLLVFKNGTLVKTLKEVSDFIAPSYFTISSTNSTPSITGNMDEFRISDFAVWTSDFTPKTTRYLNNGEDYDSYPRGDVDDEFVLLGKKFKDDSLHAHEVTNVGCSIMAPT
ncbi:MAG: LamG domain-containing protein [Clostridium sp.]|nr:LamG domain-containing protein [Clostridium sp.]MDY4183912.1 LamG-like jellyroll fold domain-containing protein [Candidatus Onthovivens sp.]